MNILVANLSKFAYSIEERSYEIRIGESMVESINARHTNESILRCVLNLSSVQKTGGLGKFLLLVSNEAQKPDMRMGNLSALQYICDLAREANPQMVIIPIMIEDCHNQDLATCDILAELCANINDDDVVYIDGAGGKRTTSSIVQLLAKILKYKGIRNPYTLYSDIQNKKNFITDTSEFTRLTDLADAFNEFMTTGKAQQFTLCLKSCENTPEYARLIKAMNDFSDKVRLGRVESLDKTIAELRKSIEACRNSLEKGSIETVVIKQFLPVIEAKLLGNKNDSADYLKILQWCLDNLLIQQALTLFVEKVPVALFEHRLIRHNNLVKAKKDYAEFRANNAMLPIDWETYAFFTSILDCEKKQTEVNPEIQMLKDRLKGSTEHCSPKIEQIVKKVQSLEKGWPIHEVNMEDEQLIFLDEYIKKHTSLTSYIGFRNTLCNEPTSLAKLLGHNTKSPKQGKDTIAQKLVSIEQLAKGRTLNTEFTFCIPNDKLVAIYYSYVYAKAIRNQTNHASGKENLNEARKNDYRQMGYDMNMDSLEAIQKNLQKALDIINECIAGAS